MRPSFPRLVRGSFLCLLCLCGATYSVHARPFVPSSDEMVVEFLPADVRADALRRLLSMRRTGAAEDLTIAATLARRYIEQSRATADPRLLGYAQGVLGPWWTSGSAPTDVLLLKAIVLQSRHDFDGALLLLSQVIERRPYDAQAWLTRAMVLRVQGHYAEAISACQQIAPSFSAEVCGLTIAGLAGPLRTVIDTMRALNNRARQESAAVQTWYDLELAEMLERSGQKSEAESQYRAALQRNPADPGLLAAYADLLLDTERYIEAEALTAKWVRVDALALRHVIARHQRGNLKNEMKEAMADSFKAAYRRGEELHLREEARFALEVEEDPSAALALAARNWKVQREPADLRLLVAAALAADSVKSARTGWDWMAATGLEDVRVPNEQSAAK